MQIKITSKDFTLEYQDEYSRLEELTVTHLKSLIETVVKETKNQPTKEEQIENHLVPSSSNYFGSSQRTVWLDDAGNLVDENPNYGK
jgi:hypothetical protein